MLKCVTVDENEAGRCQSAYNCCRKRRRWGSPKCVTVVEVEGGHCQIPVVDNEGGRFQCHCRGKRRRALLKCATVVDNDMGELKCATAVANESGNCQSVCSRRKRRWALLKCVCVCVSSKTMTNGQGNNLPTPAA